MRQNPMLQRGMVLDPRARGLGAVPSPNGPAPPLGDQPQRCAAPGAPPGMGAARNECGASRVVLAGGALNQQFVDPMFVPFEQLFRALPEEGMFAPTVSPSRPFAFELGAFRVPSNMALLVFDLRPDIYRWSGVDAGDALPVEARRFSACLGFDFWVDQQHSLANVQYQLDPQPIDFQGTGAFAPNPGSTDLFTTVDISTASNFASPAGAGTSLQPQRPARPGAASIPFMLMATSSQTVQLRCVIFHPIPTPIAFIEYGMSGLLVPELTMEAYLACMRARAEMPR